MIEPVYCDECDEEIKDCECPLLDDGCPTCGDHPDFCDCGDVL